MEQHNEQVAAGGPQPPEPPYPYDDFDPYGADYDGFAFTDWNLPESDEDQAAALLDSYNSGFEAGSGVNVVDIEDDHINIHVQAPADRVMSFSFTLLPPGTDVELTDE